MPKNETERQDNAESSRELWKYVLYQAMWDLIKPKGNRKERTLHQQSALYWFNDQGNDSINSFIGICETLGLDPDNTRKKILNKKRKGV
jgi:hypothetical protein